MIATPAQMADALRAAGFSAAEIPVGVAIGLAESGGDTNAYHVNSNGTADHGVWQINDVNRMPGDLYDLQTNANAARVIYLQQGWQAWSTFNSGKYQTMSVDPAAYNAVPTKGSPKPKGKPDWKGVAPGPNYLPLPSLPGIPDGVTHFFAVLSNPDFWRRFGVGFLGAIVAIIGIATMLESNKTVQSATKLAAV